MKPAFPTHPHYLDPYVTEKELEAGTGMTLRDYFAAAAAQGCLAAPEEGFVWTTLTPAIVAKHAYEVADAMMRERAKQ